MDKVNQILKGDSETQNIPENIINLKKIKKLII